MTATAPLESEESMLAFTHQIRKDLVIQMTKDNIPTDNEDRNILLKTLADIDKAALGRKRIKVEENHNKNQEQAASLVADVLSRIGGNSPYRTSSPVHREIPVLSNDIPVPMLNPGETDVIVMEETYETFIDKFKTNDD